MGERCARWFRVSTDKQDEQNQVACVDAHIAARGYQVAATFTLHAKSASRGEQEPELAEVLEGIGAGAYSVVVVANSSRLDRRGDLNAQIAFAAMVRLAGGRVESVDEPEFGRDDLPGWMQNVATMAANAKFSRDLKASTRRGLDRVHANGALDSRVPWGFTITGPKYGRRMVPTDQAREYVPQIYARVIAGESLGAVARWLDGQGVATERGRQWAPRVLGRLIRNPAYAGAKADAAGQTVTTCEPLTDWATWARAGAALAARPKRGPVLAENRCALSGAARCLACGGPLYRIACGRPSSRSWWLRCTGTGPARQNCGAPMIPLATAEALADEVIGNLANPVHEIIVVPGNAAAIDAALAALDYERRQVALRGLGWADEDAERARIRAAWDLAAATERVPDRRMVTDTGVTYGQRWHKLDAHGRADWLRSGEFTVLFLRGTDERATASRDGVSIVLAWHEDD